ncbi:hypothetical protein K501DRAFT_206769, partial [Backusella circina FSU 941]
MKSVLSLFLLVITLVVVSAQDVKKDKLFTLAIGSDNNVIKLNSNSYDRFTEGKRSYGIVVLLTATDARFNCMPCREFDPEYALVASQFRQSELFFGRLDFQDGQAIYQKLGLTSAPNVYYFPPQEAGQHTPFIKYDLASSGFGAEAFAEFLSKESKHRIVVKRPTDYVKLGGKVFLIVGVLAMLKLVVSNMGFLFSNKYVWAAVTIGSILTMTSGFMWNRIRNPPYVMPGKNGEINYIGSGFSQQLGMEQQIVAGIYGSLAFVLGALIISVPKLDDVGRQRAGVYIWMACFIFIFSCLLVLFKIKNGGYPFKLLL